MKRRVMLLLCVLLAGQARAAGITSFEPDTASGGARDREPMTEAPYWFGWSWSAGTEFMRGRDERPLDRLAIEGYTLTATFPHRSRLQTWAEFSYGTWRLTSDYDYSITAAPDSITTFYRISTNRVIPMATLRGGIERRMGRRSRPWLTMGAGLGVSAGSTRLAALDATARATVYTYRSASTRVGLQFSGGPMWHWNGALSGDEAPRRHYAAGIRLEHRMRYPSAVSPAGEPVADPGDPAARTVTPIWLGVAVRSGNALASPDRPFGSSATDSRGFAIVSVWPWRSAAQGLLEFGYDSRLYHQPPDALVGFSPSGARFERARVGVFSMKGGVERRVGDRERPRFAFGFGTGAHLAYGDDDVYGFSAEARATKHAYPSRSTRVGLTFAAGPSLEFNNLPSSLGLFGGSNKHGMYVHTIYTLALRFERRLRFHPSLLTD